MNEEENATKGPNQPGVRKPWSPPLVILSELRSTDHIVGKTPLDKVTVVEADHLTPGGSAGS